MQPTWAKAQFTTTSKTKDGIAVALFVELKRRVQSEVAKLSTNQQSLEHVLISLCGTSFA